MVLTICILVSALLGGFLFFRHAMKVGAGFTAKWVATLRFASRRTLEDILENDIYPFNPLFKPFIKVICDDEERAVKARALGGLVGQKALFRDGLGATLMGRRSAGELRRQAPSMVSSRLESPDPSVPWPEGNHLERSGSSLFDKEKLRRFIRGEFEKNREKAGYNTRAIMVIHRGKVIDFEFAPGFTENTPLPGWSMAKSVVNALAGLLINEGRLSLDQNELFPSWQKDGRREITLDQMLQMRSGLKFSEKYLPPSDATRMLFLSDCAACMAMKKSSKILPGGFSNTAAAPPIC